MQVNVTSIDEAAQLAWTSWSEGPVSVLYDSDSR